MTTKHVLSKLMEMHKCLTVLYKHSGGYLTQRGWREVGQVSSLPRENDAEIVLKLILKKVHRNWQGGGG